MAKYSTGGGTDGGSGGACELCGRETENLREATVAGATLAVCGECAPHGDDSESEDEEQERSREAAQNVARLSDAARADPDHWVEEGTDYEEDRLPYLVSDYGARVERARRDAGLQRDELAEELGIDENDLLAVEQGRATRAGVGGSVVCALEERLRVSLAED
ncbi:MAG: multiprotein-bridging factor 1 family protein [Halobacteriaceae archaeon]